MTKIGRHIELNDSKEFKHAVAWAVARGIEDIVETGTYLGTGSTQVLAATGLPVITFECNQARANQAKTNLANFPNVKVVWGLTLNRKEAEVFLANDRYQFPPEIIHDAQVGLERSFYEQEIAQGNGFKIGALPDLAPDDLLWDQINNDRRQLIFLDSAGGLGWVEYRRVLQLEPARLKNKIMLLDDCDHVKHYRTVQDLKAQNEDTPNLSILKIIGFKVHQSPSGRLAWVSFGNLEPRNQCDRPPRAELKIKVVIPTIPVKDSMLENCVASLTTAEPTLSKDDILVAVGEDGFAKTVNRGVAQAFAEEQDDQADIVLLVNTDVLFTRPVLDQIRRRFEADPQLGVMGAKLFYPDGRLQHAGGWVLGGKYGHLAYKETEIENGWVDEPYYLPFVTGALVAFRRQVWEQQGGFDEKFFLDHEDSLFCFNAWTRGWKVLYDPALTAIHAEGLTRGEESNVQAMKRAWWKIKRDDGYALWQKDYYTKVDWNGIHKAVWEANGSYPETLINLQGAMGDVIALTAAIHDYKRANPHVNISVRTDYPEVFKGNPDVDDAGPNILSARARVVDMSLAWQMNPSGNLPASFYPPLDLPEPAFHALPWIYSGPNDLQEFFRKVQANALPVRYAVIHAARTHWRSKSLPELFYRKLAHAFMRINIGVLVIGGDNDAHVDHPGVVDLRGKTTLLDLREIIRGAQVFIGPDSGPLWVAMSTDTPAIGLFTCTDPKNILPIGNQVIPVRARIACQGCMHREKPPVFWVECPENNRYECVNGFDADEVMAHACGIVSRGTPQ